MELDPTNLQLEEENQESLKDWVLRTFKRRECIKFIPKDELKQRCYCGRRQAEHTACDSTIEDFAQPQLKWTVQNHTHLFPTNAFGTVEFQNTEALSVKAEYIRLSFDTKPQHIIKLLKSYWHLELPKLIISIHGGIANFSLQSKLKHAIEKGLLNVANTSKIWIITGGTNTGVVKHIGDILKNHFPKSRNNLVAIGIAPWGVVTERDSLLGCEIDASYYPNQTLKTITSVNLNSYHSYFLLVDDGTVGKYGCETSFRRRLERFISRHKSEIFIPGRLDVTIEEKITLQNHLTIPLVSLVIEGGRNTIESVSINTHDEPPVPVVICDGSGRAADLIAFAYKYAHILNDNKPLNEDLKKQFLNTIKKTFTYDDTCADTLFGEIMKSVSKRELISIYRLGEAAHAVDVAILGASLKIIDGDLSKQFDLIMNWNRPDIAKNSIILFGNAKEKSVLEEKMFNALTQDNVDFVKLFLEYGVNLQKFLTFKRLQELYNSDHGPYSTLSLIVKDVVKRKFTNENDMQITLPDMGLVINKLMGSGYISLYSKREFKAKYNTYWQKIASQPTVDQESMKPYMFNNAYNELLVWAVLTKRHKMALFFCKRGEETLAKSLVACKLNKSLAREAELDDLDSEICDEFKLHAEEFETLALGLLDRCYKQDDDLTDQLLTYDLTNWSNWTCLNLAYSGNLKEFLSHAACQTLISDLWMGGMKMRKYVTYKVISALLFPPAIFAIKFKTVNELKYMPQTEEEHEKELNESDSVSECSSHPSLIDMQDLDYAQQHHQENSAIDLTDQELNPKRPSVKKTRFQEIIEMYGAPDTATAQTPTRQQELLQENDLANIDRMSVPARGIPASKRNTLNLLVKPRAHKLKFRKKIYEFYNAPITKFWQNVMFYMAFLLSLTYIILVKTPVTPSAAEIIVLTYMFTFGCDKIRELLQCDPPRFSGKLKVFFSKIMNTMDCLFVLTIIVALPFRFTGDYNHIMVARLIYCVNSIYWYIKVLEFLMVNRHVGPLIIIATRMLVDLFNFVVVLLVVLISFGLSRQAIRFPNKDFEWESVKQIFLQPYFILYGEVYADEIDPPCDAEALAKGLPQCMPGFWITPFTLTVFMLVSVLLLFTVLVASFNATFLRINRKSTKFWRFQLYDLVTSYEAKPLFSPPFSIFSHVYRLFQYFFNLCRGRQLRFNRKLKAFLSDEMIERLHDFEEKVFLEYNDDKKLTEQNKMEEKVNYTANKTDNIYTKIDDIHIKENMTKLILHNLESEILKMNERNRLMYDNLDKKIQLLQEKLCNSNRFVKNIETVNNKRLKMKSSSQNVLFKIGGNSGSVDVESGDELDENKSDVQAEIDNNENVRLNEETYLRKRNIADQNSEQSSRTHSSNEFRHYMPTMHVRQQSVMEYMSITDAIDTSEIDRPVSPQRHKQQLLLQQRKHSIASTATNNDQNKIISSKPSINDFSAISIDSFNTPESLRTELERRESNVLKIAEEMQHETIKEILDGLNDSESIEEDADEKND